LEKDIITVYYEGLPVKVPHPARFGIHKLIISQRRQSGKSGKKDKDIKQGIEVLNMVVRMGEGERIKEVLEILTKKQKKFITEAVKDQRETLEILYPELENILC
jgi:hypothetical protein